MYEIYEYHPNSIELVEQTTIEHFFVTYEECDQFKQMNLLI